MDDIDDKQKVKVHIKYLIALTTGRDPFSGAPILGISDDTKNYLFTMISKSNSNEYLGAISGATEKTELVNARKAWTADEENRLIVAYKSGKPLTQISVSHGRTRGGIISRLRILGYIDNLGEVPEVYKPHNFKQTKFKK